MVNGLVLKVLGVVPIVVTSVVASLVIRVADGVVRSVVKGVVITKPEKIIDGDSPTFLHTKSIFGWFEAYKAIASEQVSKNYPSYQN